MLHVGVGDNVVDVDDNDGDHDDNDGDDDNDGLVLLRNPVGSSLHFPSIHTLSR